MPGSLMRTSTAPTLTTHISKAPFSRGRISTTPRGLTQDQIDTAFGNLETNLPAGLTRPAHWSQSQDEQTAHISRVVA